MNNSIKKYLTAALTAVCTILLFYAIHEVRLSAGQEQKQIMIGFVFEGDESTPYTANFIRAMDAITMEFSDRVQMVVKNNVPYSDTEQVLRQLVQEGCDLIVTNSFGYGEVTKKMAGEYPDVEFCEATCNNANEDPVYENYHTFMGEIYEGRYIAGKVAGLKMQQLIDKGYIREDEAWVGYVAAYPVAEVISGYTAFFLGVRSECPSALMRVKYTNTWTSYTLEKTYAEELIEEGCIVISQHSDTIGPAVACENASSEHRVYHVGYNQDMIDVAPTTSLIGTRINWAPYLCAAVKAVLEEKRIEDVAKGHVHGNDVGAGLEEGWVRMLELNSVIAADGSAEMIEKTMKAFQNGSCKVFFGDYIGVNPEDPKDTYDLSKEYQENANCSAPTFSYILRDVIFIE